MESCGVFGRRGAELSARSEAWLAYVLLATKTKREQAPALQISRMLHEENGQRWENWRRGHGVPCPYGELIGGALLPQEI